MAITADKLRKRKDLHLVTTELVWIGTAATLYRGALVNYQAATARVKAATATAGLTFAGEVWDFENTTGSVLSAYTGNTAGTVKALVAYGHQALVTLATGIRTTSKVGKLVYCSDNDIVQGTAAGTALVRISVGNLISRVGSTEGYVTMRRITSTLSS